MNANPEIQRGAIELSRRVTLSRLEGMELPELESTDDLPALHPESGMRALHIGAAISVALFGDRHEYEPPWQGPMRIDWEDTQ